METKIEIGIWRIRRYEERKNMNADFRIDGKVIETKRLILRSFKQTDLEDFYEYASVEGVGEMAGWKHHENIAESQSIMNSFISEDKVFAICLKKNNKVIGTVGIEKYGLEDALTEFKDYYGRELGYVLSKDYWGNGLVPEAVNAVIDYLFNELDYDFLLCGYYNFNERSKRVQEKCGFKPYRSLAMTTQMGTKEQGTLMLLMNPKKNIKLFFSHRGNFNLRINVKFLFIEQYNTQGAPTSVAPFPISPSRKALFLCGYDVSPMAI